MTLDELRARKTPPKPNPNPRWLREEYEGSENARADDVFAAVYWHLREKAEAKAPDVDFDNPKTDTDKAAREQLFSDALNRAAVQSNLNKDGFERAFLILSNRVNRTGSFRFTQDEYSTFEEWIADNIFDLPKGSGELSNFLYFQNEFVPIIEEIGNGFTADDLFKFKEYKAKGFAAVPFLRQKTDMARNVRLHYEKEIEKESKEISKLERKAEGLPPEEARPILLEAEKLKKVREKLEKEAPKEIAKAYKEVKNAVETTLDLLQDKSVPAWGPAGIKQHLISKGNITTFQGSKVYVTDEDEAKCIFMVTVPVSYERAVESMLRTLIEFQMTDGQVFVELAKTVTKSKDKLNRR